MPMRLSGLTSGLDTEAIVTELMKAKSMQKTKVENKKTKLEWTQEKWKDLNTKLYSFYTDKVSNMRLSGSYNQKKVSVSDSSVVSITGKSTAINGNYSLEINKIATANYVTSAKMELADGRPGEKITSNTKLSELRNGDELVGKEIAISYKGRSSFMQIDENTTVGDYVKRLRSVGMSASFDEAQQRLFMSSGTSGADSNFSISVVSNGSDMVGVGGYVASGVEISEKSARDILRRSVIDYDDPNLTIEDKDKVDALIATIRNSKEGTKQYADAVEELKVMGAANGTATDEQIGWAIDDYKFSSSKLMGSPSALSALGMTAIVNGEAQGSMPEGMAVIKGEDSEIILNGAKLTGSETTMNVNGLNIELKGLTNGSKVSFSVSNDVDAAYESIKSFLTEYNSLLDEMNTSLHAPSARGYDPLTDEEKQSMTDNQIELWEDKIKASLLRNDSTLNGIVDSMKRAMMSSVEVDGKKYTLSSLGIMTSSDYTEYGKLHIYGDKDDSTYADKEDKLRSLLESDPDLVTKIMTGISQNLYDTMQDKMASVKNMSSALTFYNDKSIKKQITDYESSITSWTKKLQEMEDKYYKQFTAMEKAMAKMQSSQNSFASMLGTN